MSYSPVRLDENAIRRPSGDQTDMTFSDGSKVNRVSATRARSINQISLVFRDVDRHMATVDSSGESEKPISRVASPTLPSRLPARFTQLSWFAARLPAAWKTNTPSSDTANGANPAYT